MASVELAPFNIFLQLSSPHWGKDSKDYCQGLSRVYQVDPHFAIQITAEVRRNLDKMILNIVKNNNNNNKRKKKKVLEPKNPKPKTATFSQEECEPRNFVLPKPWSNGS